VQALGRAAAWALVLGGCATATLGPGESGPYLAGRLSVRVDATPVRAVTAAFELRGDARAGVLLLTSPLGATMAEARWSPESTVLTAPGSQTLYADLDDLAAQALGERLPMAALFDWLRGRPWAGAPSQALGGDQAGFLQLGWQVHLDRFADGVVEAQREAPPPVSVRAKLDRAAP
jgi:outer membrane lipoprotein LolB